MPEPNSAEIPKIPSPEGTSPPERPEGKIEVKVSQPDLLYLLAKDKSKGRDKFPQVCGKDINDNLISGVQVNLFRPDSNEYSYNTRVGLSQEQIDSPTKGYYTPERTAKVIEILKSQAVSPQLDTVINGLQRIKIYGKGNYGVEVFLGWPSKEAAKQYYLREAELEGPEGYTAKYNLPQLEEITNANNHISLGLKDKKRLDKGGLDTYPVIHQTESEFIEQTEFYRKTLEQVLTALYQEAKISPNVEITIRPPIMSEDKITEIKSVTQETVQVLRPEQIRQEIITLDDIKGQPEAVLEAKRLVRAINQPEVYKKRGIKPPKGILFVGPPGTGKTMLAKGIAFEANAIFYPINAADIGSAYVNESAQLMNAVFDLAEKKVGEGKSVIVFIDEIDALAALRQGANREDIKTISILLQRLDGIATRPGITLLSTTNRPEAIDPAILRPGRIDKIITVSLPNPEGRLDILKSHAEKARKRAQAGEELFEGNIDLDVVAKAAEEMSGADLENLINRALEIKLDLELEGKGWQPVTSTDLINLIPAVRNETQQKSRLGFRFQPGPIRGAAR